MENSPNLKIKVSKRLKVLEASGPTTPALFFETPPTRPNNRKHLVLRQLRSPYEPSQETQFFALLA